MKTLAILGASIVAAIVPESAYALSLQFTLLGTDYHLNSDGTVTPNAVNSQWFLDSSPTPDYYSTGGLTSFDSVAGNFNYGTGIHADVDDLSFYAAGYYAATSQALFDSAGIIDIVGQAGKPFYTGTEAHPVFQTGTFLVQDYFSASPLTLTISNLAAAAPEPASWLLMLGGFGIAGGYLRARRRSVSYSKA